MELLRGRIAFASSYGGEALAPPINAARQFESLDSALARETYLDAWTAALLAGPATAEALHEVSRAALSALNRPRLSNPEIGARLFLSPRTVEWHLTNVFTKLGVHSRLELAKAMAASGVEVASG